MNNGIIKRILLPATVAPGDVLAAGFASYSGMVVVSVALTLLACLGYYAWHNKDNHGSYS